VLEALPYGERVEELRSESELDSFLRLHAAGSSRPRVVVIVDDVRRRLMPVYAAAERLAGTHHFAQLGAQRWVVERFKVQRWPCFLVIDPATRQGATQHPQTVQDGSGRFAEQVSSQRLLPEFTNASFQERCGGEWAAPCSWVALFLVPAGALGRDEAARRALRRFREACKLVRQHAGQGFECFWLRHDGTNGGAAWHEALRPLLSEHGPPAADAKGIWTAAVAGETLKATVFAKPVVDRELAQRDLTQWLQQLLAAGTSLSGRSDWPSLDLTGLPPLPGAVEELTGPKGMMGRLQDSAVKAFKRLADSTEEAGPAVMQVLVFGAVVAWPLLNNFLSSPERRPAAPAGQRGGLSNGQAVMVDGLRQHTEYNGLQGRVVGRADAGNGQPAKYRVELKVDGQDRILAIRGDHLRPAPCDGPSRSE